MLAFVARLKQFFQSSSRTRGLNRQWYDDAAERNSLQLQTQNIRNPLPCQFVNPCQIKPSHSRTRLYHRANPGPQISKQTKSTPHTQQQQQQVETVLGIYLPLDEWSSETLNSSPNSSRRGTILPQQPSQGTHGPTTTSTFRSVRSRRTQLQSSSGTPGDRREQQPEPNRLPVAHRNPRIQRIKLLEP